MAKQITNIKRIKMSDQQIREKNLLDINEAISEHKEAVLNGIEMLAAIHETGTLDMLKAFVKRQDEALENVINELNKPKYSKTLENLNKLFLFLGEIDMDELQQFTQKINKGLVEVNAMTTEQKTSYMDLLKAMKDPEINRSITLLLQFLRGMGRTV